MLGGLVLFSAFSVQAQSPDSDSIEVSAAKVDYGTAPVIDSDFDGLTDQGEVRIYHTDSNDPDTDHDGFFDGTEVLRGTDPLSASDPMDLGLIEEMKQNIQSETPWAWYVTRSAGLLGFAFLWLSVLLGLSIRNNILKRIIDPIYSFEFHCFLGASALFWGAVHGFSTVFDRFFGMGIKDVLTPFRFGYQNFIFGGIDYLALGIIAFYALIILVVTSYAKRFLSQKVWRALHFLNPVAFIFVVLHGYFIGTDMKNVYVRNVFLWSAVLLVVIYFSNLLFVLRNNWKKNQEESLTDQNNAS